MRVGTSCMKLIPFALLGIVAIAAASRTPAAEKKVAESAPPTAEVLATLDFASELRWYYRNDVGILLVYADDRLHALDLLADTAEPVEPLHFPGLTEKRSVLPVARTGLLLIPDSVFEGTTSGSYAIDTITGQIVWRAPALPGINRLFSFPDAGLAVLLSPDDGGRLIALDLSTGERVWEIAKSARMIWTEAPYVRVVVENVLLTLDVHTGEIVRQDDLTLPDSKRLVIYYKEGVILLWNNRKFIGYSVPPIPPADAAPPRKLWEFKAGGMMIGQCIKIGNCRIRRVADDLLLVVSAGKKELIRLTTGELIANVKQGFFGTPVSASPTGKYIVAAASEKVRILDGDSGEAVHEIEYPKGGEGMKSLRYLSWPTDDLLMTVFPDKKGNPRKMIASSCSDGSLVWSTVLPDVADYRLTSDQRAKLVGRIMTSLIMTAVSAANPVSAGGYDQFAVFVPSLDVSESFAAGLTPTHEGEAGGESPFSAALARHAKCERRIAAASATTRYFVAGSKKQYDVLKINLTGGGLSPLARYDGETVHAIAPFVGFERAVTLENDNTRVRLLGLD